MSIKNSPTRILNSAHISPFIGFFHRSLVRLLEPQSIENGANKIEIHVECEHHCNNSSLYVFLFQLFFVVAVTWRLMIRNKLIHEAEGKEKKLFISKPIHMLCCQHIFALSSVECLRCKYKSSHFFLSRFFVAGAWKDAYSICIQEGDCIASSIDICSHRRLPNSSPLYHLAVFWISRNTHV